MLCFAQLCFIVLHGYHLLYKSKARPSTCKRLQLALWQHSLHRGDPESSPQPPLWHACTFVLRHLKQQMLLNPLAVVQPAGLVWDSRQPPQR